MRAYPVEEVIESSSRRSVLELLHCHDFFEEVEVTNCDPIVRTNPHTKNRAIFFMKISEKN